MTSSRTGSMSSTPASGPVISSEQHRKSQPRQLLSCTMCRERKVRCDRTKPCSACCARGNPKECEFVVGQGNDYSQIQQSYEIRHLREENQRLKERLQTVQSLGPEDEHGNNTLPDGKSFYGVSKARAARQRRFVVGDRVDNLYFGTPGLANVISDFASLQVGNHPMMLSLTHTIPKGQDLYTGSWAEDQHYPFPMVPGWDTVAKLVQCLPEREELFLYLDMFQKHAQYCSLPHTPDEMTKKEVECFLDGVEYNASKCPDMLALIFATLASGLQMGQYDGNGGQWVERDIEATARKSNAFIAASMQALRVASFMSRPTLLSIQTLIILGPYLTNSGRFLDAWTLFGTTIRLAHSIGLHRNPKYLDPTPSLRECTVRQTLWWWMLHMDQQYSVTLGRPLGISGIGDCPPPEPLTTNPTMLRLGEFVNRFTILARQILSSDGLMSVSKIDEFTDNLVSLWDTMPAALQFNESWANRGTPLPEWPLEIMSATFFAKVHSFLLLLNRQRVERTQDTSLQDYASQGSRPHPNPQPQLRQAPLRGRPLVIQSSVSLLQTFVFFYERNPAVLICWTIAQQAFNASMVLILDSWETDNEHNEWLIKQAYVIFTHLQKSGIHKLARLAVQRISTGLHQLEQRKAERASLSTYLGDQPLSNLDHQRIMGDLSMTDFSGDSVMGNTGIFLLENPDLEIYVTQPFQPYRWNVEGPKHPPDITTALPRSHLSSPHELVNQLNAVPFPVVSSPFMPSTDITFMNGLPFDMSPQSPRQQSSGIPLSNHARSQSIPRSAFATNNVDVPTAPLIHYQGQLQSHQKSRRVRQNQSSSSSSHGPRYATNQNNAKNSAGAGARRIHRSDKPPRSQQRRK